jgi:hypothetical protein
MIPNSSISHSVFALSRLRLLEILALLLAFLQFTDQSYVMLPSLAFTGLVVVGGENPSQGLKGQGRKQTTLNHYPILTPASDRS